MSDQTTFEEHLEDVRESESSDENVLEMRMEHMDQVAQEESTKPLYSYSIPIRIGLGATVLIFSLILALVISPSAFEALFIVSFALFIFMMVSTKTMIAIRKELMHEMKQAQQDQQQQSNTNQRKSEKIVCQSCGWKNPKINNYCHDCGDEI